MCLVGPAEALGSGRIEEDLIQVQHPTAGNGAEAGVLVIACGVWNIAAQPAGRYPCGMRIGHIGRWMARDALLALIVIALTFLNFGHTSAVFAAGGRVVVTGHSICGEQPAQHDGDHFACHACRPDTAALPPPPLGVEPVCFAVAPVRYDEAVEPVALRPTIDRPASRGPPSAAI